MQIIINVISSFLVGKLSGQTGSASVADSVNILVMASDDISRTHFRVTDGLIGVHVASICTCNWFVSLV
jgi:hypothetical protein